MRSSCRVLIVTCLNCGTIFTHTYNRKFCSRKCANSYIKSAETKIKLSLGARGNRSRTGQRQSVEERAKKSAALRKTFIPENELYDLYVVQHKNTRQIANIYNIDKSTVSAELKRNNIHVRNHSESQVGKVVNAETKERLANARKGTHFTEEQKERQRQNQIGKHDYLKTIAYTFTDEIKHKISLAASNMWKNPIIAKKILSSGSKRPNKAEYKLLNVLSTVFPDSWMYVGDGTLVIDGKCPDFVDLENNKLIELFGDYWHRGENPQERIDMFTISGYETLVVWEKELKDMCKLINKIYLFVKN